MNSADEDDQLKSLSKEDFDKLPRLSRKDIDEALAKGRAEKRRLQSLLRGPNLSEIGKIQIRRRSG
jgi:hypothetical protein